MSITRSLMQREVLISGIGSAASANKQDSHPGMIGVIVSDTRTSAGDRSVGGKWGQALCLALEKRAEQDTICSVLVAGWGDVLSYRAPQSVEEPAHRIKPALLYAVTLLMFHAARLLFASVSRGRYSD